MKTTLTRRGQTVVPAEIRKRYNLQEGDKLMERLLAERRAEYKLNGSLGIAVIHRQIWRQLHCRPPAVQLLAQHCRQKPESQLDGNTSLQII